MSTIGRRRMRDTLVAVCLCAAAPSLFAADMLVEYDFTKGALGWQPSSYVKGSKTVADGTIFTCVGEDPYLTGPVLPNLDIVQGKGIIVTCRFKLTKGEDCQFFYGPQHNETDSQHFQAAPDGQFHDYRLDLPPQKPGSRLRLDLPGDCGDAVLVSIKVQVQGKLPLPNYADPGRPEGLAKEDAAVTAGKVSLRLWGKHGGYFEADVDGKLFACGYTSDKMAVAEDADIVWLELARASAKVELSPVATVTLALDDSRGDRWTMTRRFKPVEGEDAVEVEFSLTCSRERRVFHVPVFTMLPGFGSFGPKKTQAVLCGCEYLEDEPSSSEKDIRGPGANRLIPDPLKITLPLMAVCHEGRYIGLMWDAAPEVSAIFDSPNRTLGQGGHLMGLVAPAPPRERRENRLWADIPMAIGPNRPLKARFVLIAGTGNSMVPVFRHYVRMRGLPPLPKVERVAAERTLAGGWLDSKLYEGGKYRHAFWGGFGPQPAADAAVFMMRLAQSVEDAEIRERLKERIPKAAEFMGQDGSIPTISHVAYQQAVPLVLGRVAAAYAKMSGDAPGAIRAFGPDGGLRCTNRYREGHWSDQANGFTAAALAGLTATASVSGETNLISQALRLVAALEKFDNTVPRGAQTWEIPLHTPDILAAAYLVAVYLDAYELSGEKAMLDRAVYWGWTGIPFVYLHSPVRGVGAYATIPVYGATGWSGSWFGLPVQWCGLVYSAALYRLAEYDSSGPWLSLAQGITACGSQMTWPSSDKDRQGLLPDFYHLREQRSDGPAINPGTLGANLPGLFGQPPYYRFKRLKESGAFVHAPGSIKVVRDEATEAAVEVAGWPNSGFYVAVAGIDRQPEVRVDDRPVAVEGIEYVPKQRLLVVRMEKSGTLGVRWTGR